MLRKNSDNYKYYKFSKFFISKLNIIFTIYNQPVDNYVNIKIAFDKK